jgi:hypothetical protein
MLNSRLLLLLLPLSAVALAARPVSFNEDIRPILADNCFSCHGTDTAHRKGDRRLDTPEGATAAIDGVRALVPGDLSQSELWQRIISRYDDEVMPPPESHKQPLSPEQRDLIRRWIEQGGVYQRHWAFEPMAVPAVPDEPLAAAPKARRAGSHPIDRFLGRKLAGAGLAFASEASREVLIRRVTLDLTGLPPTLAEIDAFLGDRSPQAYERVVDRLLASPRYGEHAGRFWLDAVRYADTHGMHLDNARNIWPYRDWVVGAFNRNLPFDRFTVEQLAGDLLPNPSVDQLVATGYNRNQITTAEAGAIEAEAEMRTTADRVDTTAAVWLGLTANCASCHDHKFDPLSQREYYSMGAIFKGLADRVWDGNVQVSGPVAVIGRDAAEQRRIDVLVEAIKPLEARRHRPGRRARRRRTRSAEVRTRPHHLRSDLGGGLRPARARGVSASAHGGRMETGARRTRGRRPAARSASKAPRCDPLPSPRATSICWCAPRRVRLCMYVSTLRTFPGQSAWSS